RAVAVDRADLRPLEGLQKLDLAPLPQLTPQADLHLVRGLLGEGQREDALDLHLLDEHLAEDLLDKQRRLTGPGSGRDGQARGRLQGPHALGLVGRRKPLLHSVSSAAAGASSASSARTTVGRCDFRQSVRKSQYPQSFPGRMTNSPRAMRSR